MKSTLLYGLMLSSVIGASSAFAQLQPTELQSVLPASTHQQLSQAQAKEAILKMAGEYKVNFRFEELYSLKPGYEIKKNDLSSGHETVIVLENSPSRISLQHILVDEGHVVKHWRQDWEFEPKKMWSYAGNYEWRSIALTPEQSKGKWLQTVWQIDDSPRYAGLGEWSTDNGVTAWTSAETYRPLPRREHTTRDDYDVIIGVNRHILSANGWVHEQDNVKFDTKTKTTLARELGVNQYSQIKGYDFKPAYEYWSKNKNYWQAVKASWQKAFDQNTSVALKYAEDGEKAHYSYFNDQAKQNVGKNLKAEELQVQTNQLLNQQLVKGKLN